MKNIQICRQIHTKPVKEKCTKKNYHKRKKFTNLKIFGCLLWGGDDMMMKNGHVK